MSAPEPIIAVGEQAMGFRASLPLRWCGAEDTAGRTPPSDACNLDAARKLLAIENATGEGAAGEPELTAELQLKVDYLTNLVADLLSRIEPLPAAKQVMVCLDWIEWYDTDPPEAGAEIEVCMYLNERYPLPLRLSATVECVVKAGTEWVVSAGWRPMAAELAEAFERLVFTYHRRGVARTASTRRTPGPRLPDAHFVD